MLYSIVIMSCCNCVFVGDYVGFTVSMAETVFYRALHSHRPSEEDKKDGYLDILADDILEVSSPFEFAGTKENPDGWISGRNQRTDLRGLFPGNFVEYVKTIPVLPLPPRPSSRPRVSSAGQLDLTKSLKAAAHDNNDSGYGGSPRRKCTGFYNP